MTVIELKKKLINKINRSKNNKILEEMYRLIENEEISGEVYTLSSEQKNAVEEAQNQYNKGQCLTDIQVGKEIDEWLNK